MKGNTSNIESVRPERKSLSQRLRREPPASPDLTSFGKAFTPDARRVVSYDLELDEVKNGRMGGALRRQ
jgi:hypothetical protein